MMQGESVSWRDETITVSRIEKLYLYNKEQRLWEKCSITVQGDMDKATGCMITLICDGALHERGMPEWIELDGAQTRIFSIELHQSVPLLVTGYIANRGLIGGATITLTGYYK